MGPGRADDWAVGWVGLRTWLRLQAVPGAQRWVCEPHRVWQNGDMENGKKRPGRLLSRDINAETLTEGDLRVLRAGLNATPENAPATGRLPM